MPIRLYKASDSEVKIPLEEQKLKYADDGDLAERQRMRVQNFRVVPIVIDGRFTNFLASGNPAVFVYGKPDKEKHNIMIDGKQETIIKEAVCNLQMKEYFNIIKNEAGCKTLISIDQMDDGEKYKFYRERCKAIQSTWEHESKGSWAYFRYPDYKGLSIEDFDSYYELVHKAVKGGNDVIATHCYAGAGRTGTLLASLALRQLIDQLSLKDLNDYKNAHSITEIKVREGRKLGDSGLKECSILTAKAIWYVRQFEPPTRLEVPVNRAVESLAQLESLEKLEGQLLSRRSSVLTAQSSQLKKPIRLNAALLRIFDSSGENGKSSPFGDHGIPGISEEPQKKPARLPFAILRMFDSTSTDGKPSPSGDDGTPKISAEPQEKATRPPTS